MMFFEIAGWAIVFAIALLMAAYFSLCLWCAVDDIKEVLLKKFERRVKHE